MADTAETVEGTETASAKPWGDDANFDAERAWNLIQGLRSDKAALTQELASVKADKAAAEKERDDAVKAADDAKKDLASDRREAILKEFDIDQDLAEEFLSGDLTLDELRRKAERLAGRKKPEPKPEEKGEEPKPAEDTKDQASDKSAAEPKLPARPKLAPTPGEGGTPEPKFDPDAIVAAVRQH